MSERIGIEQPYEVTRGELLNVADELFSRVPSETSSYSLAVVTRNFGGLTIAGKVAPEVEQAVRAEIGRTIKKEDERVDAHNARWEQRKLGKVALDFIRGVKYLDFATSFKPQYDISNVNEVAQVIEGKVPLSEEEDLPSAKVIIKRSNLEGNLLIPGQEFELDPNDTTLSIYLGYPDIEGDGRTEFTVTRRMLPYRKRLGVSKWVELGDPDKHYAWGRVPHQPPADDSVYMRRTMEMLLKAHERNG